MGYAKNVMLAEREELEIVALNLLVETGCLRECDLDSDSYYQDEESPELAYKLGNKRISSKELPFQRRDLTDVIKEIWEDHDTECSYCSYRIGKND